MNTNLAIFGFGMIVLGVSLIIGHLEARGLWKLSMFLGAVGLFTVGLYSVGVAG